MVKQYIKKNILKVIVKPNAKKTEILEYDENKQALKIAIAAPPQKDKANKELINFLSKHLKKKISISTGAKSREKTLKVG